jgi:hypothetical protein
VELRDEQRSGTRHIHRDRAVVMRFECTHNDGRVIDDRGLEAGCAPRRVARVRGDARPPRPPRAPARASGTMRSTRASSASSRAAREANSRSAFPGALMGLHPVKQRLSL